MKKKKKKTHKFIPALIAIVLILVIGGATFGAAIYDKYSYSRERKDLNEYWEITGESDVAVLLGDEHASFRGKLKDGTVYLDFETVRSIFNSRFYYEDFDSLLFYALPDRVVRTEVGTSSYLDGEVSVSTPYQISFVEGDTLYLAIDFVKQYTNFSYQLYEEPYHMQITTAWEPVRVAYLNKKSAVRYQGGIKSEILTDVEKGDKVIILEEMETWSKVKTKDGYLGYVENKRLDGYAEEDPVPVKDYVEPVVESNTRDHRINMGWHVIAGEAGNDTIYEFTKNTKGLNVISPTWYSLSDDFGNLTSFASESYVQTAHDMGLEVWAMVDNFNPSVSSYEILRKYDTRTYLINNLINEAATYGFDGINIDFESMPSEAGQPFVEFIRELSIKCRENNIVLSVDNYVPLEINDFYGRSEQGVFADYVVIMGYDEHYSGGEAGSVASIDYVEYGIDKTCSEVPPEKVINGIPFYTRIWETTGSEVTSQAVDMATAREWLANHSLTPEWDEKTCQNYAEYQKDDTICQCWLEDEESIKVKLTIMDRYNLGGVAEWRLGYEDPAIWDTISLYLEGALY